ncbi:MAG TPA: heavy-metal-associated domain-containing protein [Bacteroidales bacterium]|jgi:copper chaperone CopZ|nr:heavy-metal-associated domain-containing protein [Bacteroidales bacterium]HRS18732.1 heavy-metal-associated domain-containing protein [Bacteroidales bacterium]
MKTIITIVFVSIGLLTFTSTQAQEKACCAKSGVNKEQCCASTSKECPKKDTCTKRESCSKKESCPKQSSHTQTSTKQGIVTETFTVMGSCSMCKTRIENAALVKGVKSAEWNKDSHQITVIYDCSKVTSQAIHNSIAQAGHKTSLVEPNMEAYNKLPKCCAYLQGGGSSCGHSH